MKAFTTKKSENKNLTYIFISIQLSYIDGTGRVKKREKYPRRIVTFSIVQIIPNRAKCLIFFIFRETQ